MRRARSLPAEGTLSASPGRSITPTFTDVPFAATRRPGERTPMPANTSTAPNAPNAALRAPAAPSRSSGRCCGARVERDVCHSPNSSAPARYSASLYTRYTSRGVLRRIAITIGAAVSTSGRERQRPEAKLGKAPTSGRRCANGHRRAVVVSIDRRCPRGPAYEWGDGCSWAGPASDSDAWGVSGTPASAAAISARRRARARWATLRYFSGDQA